MNPELDSVELKVTEEEISSFLTLLMSSDPTPVNETENKHNISLANKMATEYGCTDWFELFHQMQRVQ